MYIWQNPKWPQLAWDQSALANLLAQVSRAQGRILGKMESIGFEFRNEAHLRSLTQDKDKGSASLQQRFSTGEEAFAWVRRLGLAATDARLIHRKYIRRSNYYTFKS